MILTFLFWLIYTQTILNNVVGCNKNTNLCKLISKEFLKFGREIRMQAYIIINHLAHLLPFLCLFLPLPPFLPRLSAPAKAVVTTRMHNNKKATLPNFIVALPFDDSEETSDLTLPEPVIFASRTISYRRTSI